VKIGNIEGIYGQEKRLLKIGEISLDIIMKYF
jgi:hypothetical protein